MEWSWQRIPAEYLVTNVKLCRDGKLAKRKGYLHVRKGRIEGLGVGQPSVNNVPILDGEGLVCAPGLVDLRASFREPGNEQMETVATGSRAAAAGGFTSVVTMSGTDPVIDNSGMVRYLIDRGREAGLCRIYPTGAISPGLNGEGMCEFGDMVNAGAVAFTDDDNPVASGGLMSNALKLTKVLGVPVITHAEDRTIVGKGVMHAGSWSGRLGMAGMGRAGEDSAVFRDVELARATGGHLHVAHVSTKGAVEIIRRAKAEGIKVTAEAAPHHFSLDHSRCRDFSPLFKVTPPLREPDDVNAVAEALADGTIDAIASDHAPHTGTEKEYQFDQAPFGATGLETSLAVGITYLVNNDILDLGQLIACMSEKPARIFDLPGGRLEEGAEADFVLIDPKRTWTVTADSFQSRSTNSAFLGETLTGQVQATFLRGRLTWRQEN
ncbi:MAG: dihydroorotase [Candidatus Krumholzibacteria bacterium]|nr:dihydroorotase [Candidatus Krumholzibacteria bacterium]